MTEPIDAARLLDATGFFDGLEPTQLVDLARHCIVERPNRGEIIFAQGDAADGLRLVVSGLLRVWLSDPLGREITLALAEPGDLLGEIALLDGAPRSAAVSAMEASTILLLRRVPFLRALDAHPTLQRHMIEMLCARLRGVTDHFGAATLLSLRSRIARLLHDLAQSHAVPDGPGARFRRQFSQGELATMLGVTREAVNKQLAAMAVDGLITLDTGAISIPDLAAIDKV